MSKTVGNALLALFLSIILSFIVTGIYIYYPLISVMLNAREGVGIGSGISGFWLLFILEPELIPKSKCQYLRQIQLSGHYFNISIEIKFIENLYAVIYNKKFHQEKRKLFCFTK